MAELFSNWPPFSWTDGRFLLNISKAIEKWITLADYGDGFQAGYEKAQKEYENDTSGAPIATFSAAFVVILQFCTHVL